MPLSPNLGVDCTLDSGNNGTAVVTVGQFWEGRKADRWGKFYSREISGGHHDMITYWNQDRALRHCTGVAFQKWVKQWDARPVTK